MNEQKNLTEKLFQFILKDEWKAFETGNQILRAIRKEYERETERETQLYQVQTAVWELMRARYPWIVQFEEVDCSVNPTDLGWGLFCYLEEMTNISKKYHFAEMDKNAEKIVNTILKYLLLSGTVAAAAEELEMDKQELNRCLKKKLGVSANEYSTMLKMECAAGLLKNTSEEVPEIAQKLGYQSEESFVKKFREQIGCRPEKYRREMCAG